MKTKNSNNKCERCSRDAHYLQYCDYCEPKRKICRSCEKSSLTADKLHRYVICRDCWGNIKKRKKYKSE